MADRQSPTERGWLSRRQRRRPTPGTNCSACDAKASAICVGSCCGKPICDDHRVLAPFGAGWLCEPCGRGQERLKARGAALSAGDRNQIISTAIYELEHANCDGGCIFCERNQPDEQHHDSCPVLAIKQAVAND